MYLSIFINYYTYSINKSLIHDLLLIHSYIYQMSKLYCCVMNLTIIEYTVITITELRSCNRGNHGKVDKCIVIFNKYLCMNVWFLFIDMKMFH